MDVAGIAERQPGPPAATVNGDDEGADAAVFSNPETKSGEIDIVKKPLAINRREVSTGKIAVDPDRRLGSVIAIAEPRTHDYFGRHSVF